MGDKIDNLSINDDEYEFVFDLHTINNTIRGDYKGNVMKEDYKH